MTLRKIFTLFIYSCFSLSISMAQTQVGGGIFDDETWTLNNSPYVVISDIVVFPENTLTIEPGVEVRFTSGTKLELRDGNLIAVGADDQEITFTLDSDDPANSPKWEGIINNAQTNDTVVIDLQYTIFEYAKTGMDYGAGYAYRYVDNSIFRNNDRAIFDGGWGYNWVTISNSIFENNDIGMEGRMSAFNCNFIDNGVAFANPMSFNNVSAGGRAVDCNFINNEKAIATIGQVITYTKVDNSVFTDNDESIYVYWADVSNSSFVGSTEVGIFLIKGFVDNCLITENVVGLQVGQNPTSLSITNNTIGFNEYGLWIDGPGAQISDNNICDNNLQNAYNNSASPINLRNNCWCLTDPDDIRSTIYDAFDDVSLGIASFEPFISNCIQGLVFPGDLNNDGQANAWDILMMGLGYESQGIARNTPSTLWVGQEADDWTENFSNGLNYKHADANGDGIIDFEDAQVVQNNYGLTHSTPSFNSPIVDNSNTFELRLEPQGTFEVGQPATIDIVLASEANPIENLYGIAFAITSEINFFEAGTFNLITSDSWLGDESNMMEMQKAFSTEGRVEIGLTKTDLVASSGHGIIASFEFVMSEDIIAALSTNGGNADSNKELELKIEAIQAVTEEGIQLVVQNEPITFFVTSTEDINKELAGQIDVMPNPTSDFLSILSNNIDIQKVTLFNAASQQLEAFETDFEKLPIGNWGTGLYFLEIQTSEGVCIKKVIVN